MSREGKSQHGKDMKMNSVEANRTKTIKGILTDGSNSETKRLRSRGTTV